MSLVERVARAIFDSHEDGMRWEKASERLCALYRRQSRRAIASMRAPTPAMIAAGTGAAAQFDEPLALAVWQAMIDEALK